MSTTTVVERPGKGEYGAFFERYVSRVTEGDIQEVLRRQRDDFRAALAAVRGAGEQHRYEPGKWSVRELVGHLVDTERIMGYRAVCVARGEKGALPGFDENEYAAHSTADAYPLDELVQEFLDVRTGHLAFFRHLDAEAWRRIGTANAHPLSVRAVAYVMAGHVRHHLAVFEERYLPTLPA